MLEKKHIRTYDAMSNSGAESCNQVIIKYMRKMLLDQPSMRDCPVASADVLLQHTGPQEYDGNSILHDFFT